MLQEHLPSVLAAARRTGIPVAVADNGSSDDTLALLASEFRDVITIPLGKNHGFGRGYNLAVPKVPWDVVIFLNNDMAVEDDFADHLLAPFRDDDTIFAASARVFFQDADRWREEIVRTSARFRRGELECAHLPVEHGEAPLPVFWLGGGSAAVSRRKFEQLGGSEELYSPFYAEVRARSPRAGRRRRSITSCGTGSAGARQGRSTPASSRPPLRSTRLGVRPSAEAPRPRRVRRTPREARGRPRRRRPSCTGSPQERGRASRARLAASGLRKAPPPHHDDLMVASQRPDQRQRPGVGAGEQGVGESAAATRMRAAMRGILSRLGQLPHRTAGAPPACAASFDVVCCDWEDVAGALERKPATLRTGRPDSMMCR